MKFSPESVAAFIAVLGILSIIAQVSPCRGWEGRVSRAGPGRRVGWGLSGPLGRGLAESPLSGSVVTGSETEL